MLDGSYLRCITCDTFHTNYISCYINLFIDIVLYIADLTFGDLCSHFCIGH